MAQRKYSRYIVTDLKMPEEKKKIAGPYSKYAERILWMDENVVPGAFHINCSWYLRAAETLENVPHVHDSDEIIGFFGSDPQKAHDLNGEIEFWMENEKYLITKSCLIFVPANLKHCPLILKRVDRPIFHFTTVPSGRYVKE